MALSKCHSDLTPFSHTVVLSHAIWIDMPKKLARKKAFMATAHQ
jgi:hypothetical protein